MKWTKKLSEAIILQSLEDLYDKQMRLDALRFFMGEGFNLCVSIIGLNCEERQKVFKFVKNSRIVNRAVHAAKIGHKIKYIKRTAKGALHKNLLRHAAASLP